MRVCTFFHGANDVILQTVATAAVLEVYYVTAV